MHRFTAQLWHKGGTFVAAIFKADILVLRRLYLLLMLTLVTVILVKVTSTSGSAISGRNYVTSWCRAAPRGRDRHAADLRT